MPGGAGILLLLLAAPAGMSASRQNAAADAVVHYGIALGIDFREKDEKASHPAHADTEAYAAAGFGSWLDSQLSTADDVVADPPPALREYLRARDATVWSVVAALEKDAPIWEPESPESFDLPSSLSATIRLEKLLIATALFEEHEGDGVLASRALESSWSLARPFALGPKVVDQILALAVAKWEAGGLRKLRDPELSWSGRLASDEVWDGMLDAIVEAGPVKAKGGWR